MVSKLFHAVADFAANAGLFIADGPAAVIDLAHRASGIDCTAAEFGRQLAAGSILPVQRGNLTLGIRYHLSFPGHAVTRALA